MSRFLNSRYKNLEAYTPGEQPKDMEYIKLNTNESPYPPSKEVIDAVNKSEVELLKLVYQTLRIMCKGSVSLPLIRAIYELRVFVVNGEYPECFQCVQCGSKEHLSHFSPWRSGMICDHCLAENGHMLYVSPSTLYTMQYIITSPIERLYTFNVSEDVLHELKRVLSNYIQVKIDRPFKSLEILEIMADLGSF